MTNKILILGLCGLALLSCNSKVRILSDGWTRVSDNDNNYKNIANFDFSLLASLDTNYIYKECCYLQNLDSSFWGLDAKKKYKSYSYPNDTRRTYYRFYSNGYCNCFITENDAVLSVNNFNPDTTGFRGVYYKDKKGRICIDLFTQTSGAGSFGILKERVTISGDTIFIRTKSGYNSYRVFIKNEMTAELKKIRGWRK